MKQVLVLLAVCGFALPQLAAAQQQAVSTPEIFKETVRHVARRTDATSDVRTLRQGNRRIDPAAGVTRAVYRAQVIGESADTPEAAARSALTQYAREFGFGSDTDLRVESTRSTDVSHHVLMRQYVAGLPVYRRFVNVSLDVSLEPTMILNGIAPGMDSRKINTNPALSAERAKSIARSTLVDGAASTSEADLQVFPSDPPRLVWRLILWPDHTPGEWEVLVDARSGDVVQLLDQAFHRIEGVKHGSYARPTIEKHETVATATGSGYVFDPDPLTSSGAPYGPPFIDSSDSDLTELNDERILVDLLEISLGNDSNYRLEGPHVKITGGGSLAPPYEPPAIASSTDFTFTRGEDHFEAVNAYYHLDKSQRYVQSIGFFDRQNSPLTVNPRAFASDNSFYTPSRNIVEFGIGGVDDAEDAGVLWHEYAHSLLEAGAPGLNASSEGQALHEGWSDFWATSYLRLLAETSVGKRDDWENVFRWDSGDGQIWPGRSVTRAGVYPAATTCEDAGDSNGDGCNIYTDGLLWATALMEIYTDVGKSVVDRLLLQSHSYLSHPVTFVDAAEAVVQADRDLFGGVHTASIIGRLSDRGYLGVVGPIVSHHPLPASEQLGGSVRVEVEAFQGNSPIQSVTLSHRVAGSGDFVDQPVVLESGAVFGTQLSLPSEPSTVEYYIEAVDEANTHTRLPGDINAFFSFDVGPDFEAPTISHVPLALASAALWPPQVVASVDDNLGVDTVWVEFAIEDGGGTVYESGSFGLAYDGTDYRGYFTTDPSALQPGSIVRYALNATDAAAAGNTAADPASGQHQFPVVFSGLLQQWDLEVTDGSFGATGAWEYGTPDFALEIAHSGDRLWGTNLSGSYPDDGPVASLELPSINLDGLGSAYLIFWHWYDFEYRGEAEPGRLVQGTFWDGGNVKVSTNGGASWIVAQPEEGYPWFIDPGASNPMGGQNAFGAYSFGWRRAVVPLPTQQDVRVRFDVGTDSENIEQSIAYAGWYIDDISISTDRPVDTTPPAVVSSPPDLNVQPVGQPLPGFVLNVTDDTGVASVFVDYSIGGEGGVTGVFPLAMSFTDLTRFAGSIPSEPSLGAGDRFEYTFRVTDFDGNETTYRGAQGQPLVIEYRTVRTVNVLVDVASTGQWVREGSQWITRSSEDQSAVSSLVLPPSTLPVNAADIWLALQHSFVLGDGLGGNLSFSADDGKTWSLLSPVDNYPARYASANHPMNGQDVFSGNSGGTVTTLFDLSAYGGKEIRLRFDYGADRAWDSTERWSIASAAIQASSVDAEIDVPTELTLNANFPDPFATTTTINYTVPSQSVVRIDVYNVLGQLVALLTNRVHLSGTYTLTFDGSTLPSGVYFLTMDVEGTRKVERMILAH